jgi:hypothetical protein
MKLNWKASLTIAIALASLTATPAWAAWRSFDLSGYPDSAGALDNGPISEGDSGVSEELLEELGIEPEPIETPVSFTDEIFQEPLPQNLLVNVFNDGPQITQVPEPGSLALLTLGLGALAWRHRARSRASKA